MGLDMFMYKVKRVKNEHKEPTADEYDKMNDDLYDCKTLEEAQNKVPLGLKEEVIPDKYNNFKIMTEFAYFRKANHIHAWIVEHIQGGKDDCNSFEMTKEKIIELRDIAQKVLDDFTKAPKLFPTTTGFFFGGTQYDIWYIKDTEQLCNKLDELIEADKFEDEMYIYRSSW